MGKVLMKGNEAIAEAAVQAGCRYFFGYPITPQNEIPAYMSKRLPEVDGVFLQAESETAAINMVYGASGAGVRAMTSSSSPGISLKQEGISYIAGAQLPAVIVNIVRGGPGLGGIQPAQSDYFQSVKGGGHGDYRMVVYAPSSVQEAVDLTMEAFEVADAYRTPVLILGDGLLGQMMEPVTFEARTPYNPNRPQEKKEWATTGWDGVSRPRNIINSLYIQTEELEQVVHRLFKRYEQIEREEVMVEVSDCDDATLILTAYGTTARIAASAIATLRDQHGIKVGLIRPITLWPFPKSSYEAYAKKDHVKGFLTVEMSMGQMVEDVQLSVGGHKPVRFLGRTGGVIPSEKEIVSAILAWYEEVGYEHCN